MPYRIFYTMTSCCTAGAAEVLAGALQGNQRCAAVVALLLHPLPRILTSCCTAGR
jgi:alpha/beta superfamily hydrolase